jgi:hypothetical protein
MVVKGPNFMSPSENETGISINLLLMSSAVTALVMNSPARKTNSH